ncbi:MAG: aminoglycoside 3'-phosphotransferase [Clostridia bacterium]|nr:aminoglycoside 3'-phosphotransferase [Clostridia bacterium]
MDTHELKLPERIRVLIGDAPCSLDEVGRSDSTVIMLDDKVLKIEKASEKTDDAEQMLAWMAKKKLPVPGILCCTIRDGMHYLLMERIQGHMVCDEKQMENREEVHALLVKGLRMLWETDASVCPVKRMLADDLRYVRERVEKGMIPQEAFYAEAFDKEDFETPEQLLQWLESHQPSFEPVLSHGDYCLPNVMIENGDIAGFIDLGSAALADRYSDIADCYQSLKNNYNGFFGGKVYPDYSPEDFLKALDIAIDREKLRYYLLLHCLM